MTTKNTQVEEKVSESTDQEKAFAVSGVLGAALLKLNDFLGKPENREPFRTALGKIEPYSGFLGPNGATIVKFISSGLEIDFEDLASQGIRGEQGANLLGGVTDMLATQAGVRIANKFLPGNPLAQIAGSYLADMIGDQVRAKAAKEWDVNILTKKEIADKKKAAVEEAKEKEIEKRVEERLAEKKKTQSEEISEPKKSEAEASNQKDADNIEFQVAVENTDWVSSTTEEEPEINGEVSVAEQEREKKKTATIEDNLELQARLAEKRLEEEAGSVGFANITSTLGGMSFSYEVTSTEADPDDLFTSQHNSQGKAVEALKNQAIKQIDTGQNKEPDTIHR